MTRSLPGAVLRGVIARSAALLCALVLLIVAGSFAPDVARGQDSGAPAPLSPKLKDDGALDHIAPFVGKDTIVVARVDLERVDYAKTNETLGGLFKEALKLFDFPQESVDACSAEFATTSRALVQDLAEATQQKKEELGTTELWYVLQTTRGDGECFIVPIKGLAPEKVEALKESAKKVKLSAAVWQNDYLLASKSPLKEIGAFYKEFKPTQNKEIAAFFKANADKLVAVWCGRMKIRPLFHASLPDDGGRAARVRQYDPFANSPRSVKNLVETIDSSFVGAKGWIDAGTLEARLEMKFSTPINAGKFRTDLADAFEAFNSFYFQLLEKTDPGAPNPDSMIPGSNLPFYPKSVLKLFCVYQWLREYYVGEFMQFLPDQDDDSLVFTLSASHEIGRIGCNTLASWYFAHCSRTTYVRLLAETKALANADPTAASPFKRVASLPSDFTPAGGLSVDAFKNQPPIEAVPEVDEDDAIDPFADEKEEEEAAEPAADQPAASGEGNEPPAPPAAPGAPDGKTPPGPPPAGANPPAPPAGGAPPAPPAGATPPGPPPGAPRN